MGQNHRLLQFTMNLITDIGMWPRKIGKCSQKLNYVETFAFYIASVICWYIYREQFFQQLGS